MKSSAAPIEDAYIDPIRTVMLIDDEFPTLGAAIRSDESRPEWDRAARLWESCRQRGWLTDVYSRHEWTASDIRCIVGSDLIVLDYHLEGGTDGLPADASRGLLRQLAQAPHTNLVVVYTSRDDLDVVQDEVIAWLHGRQDWRTFLGPPDGPLRAAFDEMLAETSILDDLRGDRGYLHAYARGDTAWAGRLNRAVLTFKKSAGIEGWQPPWKGALLAALMAYHLDEHHGAPLGEPRSVHCGQDVLWVESGNVFVTFMHKGDEPREGEADALIEQLRAALTAWKPSTLRSAVALARAEVRRAGLEGEGLSAPDPLLEASWWYSLFGANDKPGRQQRASRIASDLVAQVGDVVAERVAVFIMKHARLDPGANGDAARARASELAGLEDAASDFDLGHTLNAFLSCTPRAPTQMACGSIFTVGEGRATEYFVCVSPACDMVPRVPNGNYKWLKRLHPWRPTIVLRLSPVKKTELQLEAVHDATINRWLFVLDTSVSPPARHVFRLRPDPKTEQLSHELMFVDLRPLDDDGVQVRRISEDDGPILSGARARLIAQLRPPFAEHVLGQAGQHLSRIGTDFFGVPARLFRPDR